MCDLCTGPIHKLLSSKTQFNANQPVQKGKVEDDSKGPNMLKYQNIGGCIKAWSLSTPLLMQGGTECIAFCLSVTSSKFRSAD